VSRRTIAALGAVIALLLGVAACGGDDDGGGGSTKDTVGISMPTKSSERWVVEGSNMVTQFQAAGYEVDLRYAENVIQNQVAQIEEMINSGVKVLVIAAVDGSALSDMLRQAKEKNIPVIAYDRLLRGSPDVDYYATFDNFKVGVLQANFIVGKLDLKSSAGPFNIELFAGSLDDNNTSYFFNGAMSVLKPYIASGKLVVRSQQTKLEQTATLRWDGATAKTRMADLLSANYTSAELDAVLSPYDGISLGVIAALKAGGYDTSTKPLPVITGQDAELPSVKSIIAGDQTQTIYKDTRELVKVTVAMADAVIKGKQPEISDTTSYDNGTKVVPAYLLEPVSVDKSNYESVLIDGGYYKASQLGG
jgi:putative multiple sugar transport system substrate-binding protein